MNPVVERVVLFDCEGESLAGVLAEPPAGHQVSKTALVIVVGGPQYRAGAHRMFVRLARSAAAAGHVTMRFDVRGMGDSTGGLRNFEQLTPDIDAAIAAVRRITEGEARIVLMGLCDGAAAALLYLRDTRAHSVQGLILLNPWARSQQTLAKAHVKHYYVRRLTSGEFWRKLASGSLGRKAMREFGRAIWNGWLSKSQATRKSGASLRSGDEGFFESMRLGWEANRELPVLLALSQEDLTAAEFVSATSGDARWRSLLDSGKVRQSTIPAADHTLSSTPHMKSFESMCVDFLNTLEPLAAEAT